MSETTTPAVEHSQALIVEAMELLVKNQEAITTRLDNLDEFVTRLDQDLQALESYVTEDDDTPEWYTEMVAQEAEREKPHWTEIMDKNHDLSPTIYRYSRYGLRDHNDELQYDEIDNLGGVTYAFQIDYAMNEVYAGVAVCQRDDNFDKTIGKTIARQRMNREPFTFEYSGEESLIKSFWSHVYRLYHRGEDDALIRVLYQVETVDFVTGEVE
nr:MAG TPA: hypothetical protein [Caudoviricetes sp.]